MKIEVLADADAVAQEAAAVIAAEARAAVAARGRFIMAVSGGHTPWQMLRALAGEEVPWEGVHIVQVDERVAPAGDPDRNFTHLRESLLEHAPLRPEQIYAMPVEETDLTAAAVRYTSDTSGDRWHAAGVGPGPPGPRARRPHRLPGTRRSGPRHHRHRRRADRSLPGEASDDLDISDAQSCPARPVAGDRK